MTNPDRDKDEQELSEKTWKCFEEALEDVRHGRLHSNDEIKREFGIKTG